MEMSETKFEKLAFAVSTTALAIGAAFALYAAFLIAAKQVQAAEVPIEGTVQSRCLINTDVAGVYGNPNAYTLTTAPADGGVVPVVRYDVSLADAYIARITYPTDFSASPSLSDLVTWTGSVSVSAVSSVAMADYDTNKVEYNQTTDYDLTATGTTWFQITSTATYGGGGNKAFPGGTYRSVVVAECIAQ
jgi:hypothetical protein